MVAGKTLPASEILVVVASINKGTKFSWGYENLVPFFRSNQLGLPELPLEGTSGFHDLGRPVGQQVARAVTGEL